MTNSDRHIFAAFVADHSDMTPWQISEIVRLSFDGMRGDDFIERGLIAGELYWKWRESLPNGGRLST